MNANEMRARLRTVLTKQADPLSVFWSNETFMTHARELVSLGAQVPSACQQLTAVTGLPISKDGYTALRERILAEEATAPEQSLPVVVATQRSVVSTESAAVSDGDARVQILIEHAMVRAKGLQRMFDHQMAAIDIMIERGAPIAKERLYAVLKTADSAATAATTAARLLEMATPRTTTVSEAALTGRAPIALEEQDGRTVLIIEPEDASKEMQGPASTTAALQKWEPLLP